MRLYYDEDADLGVLRARQIAVIGYGNQGRAQALNLRDSGLDVIVGNREDAYGELAREDGFDVLAIPHASVEADIVMLLIPDEVAPAVFEEEIAPHLVQGNALVFASGYTITFGLIQPPPGVDVILVAPRMIGAGVRDLYVAGQGFPSFVGVDQDASGQAKAIALALAKGIGSTRAGVVEVSFAQETELDLFTEQCFGPAFGQVLTTAVNLLLDEGYPPEAVLLELYMSGELAYTMGKIAELGLIEQSTLHSRTSQYGSMSRGMRFILPELRTKMEEGLEEIRSGRFAQEWADEQAAGGPTLAMLKEAAQSLPLLKLEQELRQALRGISTPYLGGGGAGPAGSGERGREGDRETGRWADPVPAEGLLGQAMAAARRRQRRMGARKAHPDSGPMSVDQMGQVLRRFLTEVAADPALQFYSQGRNFTMHYVLTDLGLGFYIRFYNGVIQAELGSPATPAEVCLETKADVLDGMFTGRINAMRAAMSGKLVFSGDTKLAIGIQQIQDDLKRLYSRARVQVVGP